MPTRTINLKMVLGRKEDTAELRRALWTTHEQVNLAVAGVERVLLLCRGRSYWTLDHRGEPVHVPESQVAEDALAMAREAQRRNGSPGIGDDGEILNALRYLYEQIVPSCLLDDNGKPLKGDAQKIGTSYAGPLFDPDTCRRDEGKDTSSCGPFHEVAGKYLGPLPEWATPISKQEFDSKDASHLRFKATDGDEAFLRVSIEKADAWYEDPANRNVQQNKAYNKDEWKKEKDKGLNSWAVKYIQKQLQLGRDPRTEVRRKLWLELGLLPLFVPFFDKAVVGNLWNRLAVRLALAHLLSWESWNHRAVQDQALALAKRDELAALFQDMEDGFVALREYERRRNDSIKQHAFEPVDRPYVVSGRALRSWSRVREEWLRQGDTYESRKNICNRLQDRLRGKFGDPDVFHWLAENGREALWKERDCVTPFSLLNDAGRLVEKRKGYALMTFADARLHPRWAMYEAPGGSNLRTYQIRKANNGLWTDLVLLSPRDGSAGVEEKSFSVRLAPSGQLSNVTFDQIQKGSKMVGRCRYQSANQQFEGLLGGAEILFDRKRTANEQHEANELASRPGSVWLKLTLDVQPQAPEGWLDGKGRPALPPEVKHFKTALSNKSKFGDQLSPGLRVLSVDLGVRSFAACSVYELVRGRPDKGTYFPAVDGRTVDDAEKLWAKHERSFKITLPGECPTRKEVNARRAAMEELRSLNGDIQRLKVILRHGVLEEDGPRTEQMRLFLESLGDDPAKSALNPALFKGFGNDRFRSTPELWKQHCIFFHDKAERMVAERFSRWRTRTRPKSSSWQDWRERRGYAGGKSFWAVTYLEAVRGLILRWNMRGRTYGEVNRQDKKQIGTVASALLHHINQLKEDRIKTGANMIIQAARGFVPRKNGPGWVQVHAPCRLILFEDLARYRFRTDRSRRENSRLMRWSHREILNEVSMQGELYGLHIDTTEAGFSSRYLASSGAPGVRCRHLVEEDFRDGLPGMHLVGELDWLLPKAKDRTENEARRLLGGMVRPGMLVPWDGGELFATLNAADELHVIHADINAAQNLHRRFWGRCGEAIRIVCNQLSVDGSTRYELAKAPKARLLGALQQLKHGDALFHLTSLQGSQKPEDGYVITPTGDGRKKQRIATREKDTIEKDDLALDIVEQAEDVAQGRKTFFRDSSGVFFPSDKWLPSEIYWSRIRRRIWHVMLERNTGGRQEKAEMDEMPY